MNLIEKTVKKELIFDGKILKVYNDEIELANGSRGYREIVRHPGGAAVLLVKDGKVLLVRQFRYAYGEELLEIPAGKIERGSKEEPSVCAARELAEETGFVAKKLTSLGELYPTPGYCDERIRLYLCTEATQGKAHLDEGEFLTQSFVELDELVRMIQDNRIRDAKTVVSVLRYVTQFMTR